MKVNFEKIVMLSDDEKREILEDFGADFSDMAAPVNYDSHFEDDWISPEELYAKYPELTTGNLTATAFQLAVFHQMDNLWEHSDIPSGIELAFENIAKHFQNCQQCKDSWDENIIFTGTLKELADADYDWSAMNGWICND